MNKIKIPCSIVATSIVFSLLSFTSSVQASEISKKIENDASQIQDVINTHQSNVKEQINSAKSDLEQKKSNLNAIKNDVMTAENKVESQINELEQKADTVKKDGQTVHSTLDERHNTVEQKSQEVKDDKAHYKQVNETVKVDIDNTVSKTRQRVQDVAHNSDVININTDHLPNLQINKHWLDEKDEKIINALYKKFEQQVISTLEYEQKMIELLTSQLENYIKLHEHDFDFDDLLNKGFNLSELSDRNNALVKKSQDLHYKNQLTDHEFNSRVLDILKNDLKEKADLLERINDKIAENNNDSDLESNFVDSFTDNLNSSSVHEKTPPKPTMINHNNSSNLPQTGERKNKPIVIAGAIILILGVLILLRSRKNKK